MKIRKKLILYFSSTTIILTGITLLFIYSLFAAYREEEFQQRLKDKIVFSIKFLSEVQETNKGLLGSLDRVTINDLYEEKMLLFSADKKLIYASLDDTKIFHATQLLSRLSTSHTWIETKEGNFDVIATTINLNGKVYYGIYKAYDTFGYQQMEFLKYVLWGAFSFITLITLLITFYLSRQISSPINRMAKEISNLQFDDGESFITVPETKDEINYLARKFNELMDRLQKAFSYQNHVIHHISHELKTPITVLVSNFEKIEKERDLSAIQKMIINQKEDTIALSNTINALLEISKVEAGKSVVKETVRVDEFVIDIIPKIKALYPDTDFMLDFAGDIPDESLLTVTGNSRLLSLAFTNLLINSARYSSDNASRIIIRPDDKQLKIAFINVGKPILNEERKYLFNYFFRGKNSDAKRGFGLGLVMVHKIMVVHGGYITYDNPDASTNIFTVVFPLS